MEDSDSFVVIHKLKQRAAVAMEQVATLAATEGKDVNFRHRAESFDKLRAEAKSSLGELAGSLKDPKPEGGKVKDEFRRALDMFEELLAKSKPPTPPKVIARSWIS